MTRNSQGGNKAKGMARKFAQSNMKTSAALRTSQNEFEVYAQVVKMYGNNMCQVLCQDGVLRTCHIRGKFRGRNMRANLVTMHAWLLVGLRDYEKKTMDSNDSIKNCDLEEIYADEDKDRLRSAHPTLNWKAFIENDNRIGKSNSSSGSSCVAVSKTGGGGERGGKEGSSGTGYEDDFITFTESDIYDMQFDDSAATQKADKKIISMGGDSTENLEFNIDDI